jgi:hypothetical protein
MLGIAIFVGTRPQIIKSTPVIKRLTRYNNCKVQIIHTGQHHDYELSRVFFNEMRLPDPTINLGVREQSHAKQTAAMMVGQEVEVCVSCPPEDHEESYALWVVEEAEGCKERASNAACGLRKEWKSLGDFRSKPSAEYGRIPIQRRKWQRQSARCDGECLAELLILKTRLRGSLGKKWKLDYAPCMLEPQRRSRLMA